MGTFHDDHGELHGITVVVETHGKRLYVGRCFEEREDAVVLLDADHHDEGSGARSRAEYLARAARFGVWKQHDRVEIPRAEIRSLRRLSEIEPR